MDRNTELSVQAFWVKCREIIRPEIDRAIGNLRRAGYDANVSTQEYSPAADGLAAPPGPSITVGIHPAHATANAAHPTIEFRGDVRRAGIDVLTDGVPTQTYELASLSTIEVKAEIDRWLAGRAVAV